jgi:hypothetical protein
MLNKMATNEQGLAMVGRLSCVTLGRLPLNGDKKVEFKFLLLGCVLSSWNRCSTKFPKLQYEFCRPPLLPNLVLVAVFLSLR